MKPRAATWPTWMSSSPVLFLPSVQVGIVQTAYANGGSTRYIRAALPDVSIVVTPTGVKHLHHAAARFGVGIYFEANGHGTVLFSLALTARLTEAAEAAEAAEGAAAAANTSAPGRAAPGAPAPGWSASSRRAAAQLLALERLNNQVSHCRVSVRIRDIF